MAIVVGINEYVHDPLRFARNDAEEICSLLEQPEFGFEVTSLLDQSATRAQILRALETVAATKPERFLFFFSGHAFQTTWGGTFLATYGAEEADEGLDVQHLAGVMSAQSWGGTAVLALLDCCHAGAFPSWGSAVIASTEQMRKSAMEFTSTRAIFAACRPDEESYSAVDSAHGAFTHYLLDALTGAAADHAGEIAVEDVVTYVRRHMPHADQTTTYRGDSVGRTLLAKGLTPIGRKSLTRDELEATGRHAQSLVSDHSERFDPLWARATPNAYHQACAGLRPTVDWMSAATRKNPEIRKNSHFSRASETLQAKRVFLQHLEPGRVVDGWTVRRNLGSGGFGSVWLMDSGEALATADRRQQAFKALNPSHLANPNTRAMFDRGVKAMQQLNHSRVVKAYSKTSVPYGFFMDYIPGENVRTMMPLTDDPAAALRLLILVAETVKHAHDSEVVHRDIKPENLLVRMDSDGSFLPYLTDFDLAWYSNATTVVDNAMAALAYGAPEYHRSPTSQIAQRTTVDTFGFAQLAFFVVIGENPAPLQSSVNLQTLERRLGTWESAGVAHKFMEWYEVCSAAEPSRRPGDFSEVIGQLVAMEVDLRAGETVVIGRQRVLDEIYYSLGGLKVKDGDAAPSSFRSISGRSAISITIEDEKRTKDTTLYEVRARLALDQLVLQSRSNAKARETLNSRVDTVLTRFPGAYKSFGQKGVYEVFIQIQGVSSNWQGVRFAREVLHSCLLAIETA